MSTATTFGIRIDVKSMYVPQRSRPERGQYFFAYHVEITNDGEEPAQLISRHWVITDGMGRIEHVRGPGVVGAQPRLEPGEKFEYTSACPLPTEVGSMYGTYQMVRDDGDEFDAEVPTFTLSVPGALN